MKPLVPEPGRRSQVAVLPLDSPEATTMLQVPEAGVDFDALERALIVFALARTAGNRTHAARLLGLTRSALLYRMHKHGLDDLAASDRNGRTLENP